MTTIHLVAGCGRGYSVGSGRIGEGWGMSLVEVVWDLLVFLALVAVGMVVLRVLVGMR